MNYCQPQDTFAVSFFAILVCLVAVYNAWRWTITRKDSKGFNELCDRGTNIRAVLGAKGYKLECMGGGSLDDPNYCAMWRLEGPGLVNEAYSGETWELVQRIRDGAAPVGNKVIEKYGEKAF